MTLLWNLNFLNHNSQRSYPLSTTATKVDTTGTIRLPDSFIVAMRLPIHAGLSIEADKFYLCSLTISPVGFNIGIGYDDGTLSPPVVATTNIGRATHVEYDSYAVVGRNDFDDIVGQIAIGSLTEIDQLPPGDYSFTPAGGQLELDAVIPSLRGISSITVVNGGDRSDRIYGDVVLQAGTNMRIIATTGDTPVITFSAISGEGLNQDCECNELQQAPCIRTINGIPPDTDGDFRFAGKNCLDIVPHAGEHLLEFLNTCAEPCCGCDQLDALRTQVKGFGDAKLTLEGVVNRLSAEVTQMSLVVLGSRLGDIGCSTC